MLLFETGMRKISEERILPIDVYDKIIDELMKLSSKIESLAKSNRRILKVQEEILSSLERSSDAHCAKRTVTPDVTALLSLPGSLRKTMLALYELGEATAEDLSKETSRLRAVESAYANQLARMGYLEKKRVGRKVYFQVRNPVEG